MILWGASYATHESILPLFQIQSFGKMRLNNKFVLS